MVLMSLGVARFERPCSLYETTLSHVWCGVGDNVYHCARLSGPFSPTALAITLGISFFGQSRDKMGAGPFAYRRLPELRLAQWHLV